MRPLGPTTTGAIAFAFGGVDTLGDIHLHGKTPGKVVSLSVSPPRSSVKLIEREEVGWSGRRDSNPRPSAPKADALPDCATPRRCNCIAKGLPPAASQSLVPCEVKSSKSAVNQPVQEPQEENHWQREDGRQDQEHHKQKHPVAPSVAARFPEVKLEEAIVAPVRLPGDVENIAQEWD